MTNEKLNHAAHRYAELIGRIKDARSKADKARAELDGFIECKDRLALELRGFVGSNIRRKGIVIAGGLVVTVEWISENVMPEIHIYENDEEIS